MAEVVSLKALARQVLARERNQEGLSQGCPNARETLGQSAQHSASALEKTSAHPAATGLVRLVPHTVGEPGLEDPCAARRGRVQQLDRAFLHFCVECGRFAAFGYGVHLRTGQLGSWYCGEHRPPPAGSLLSNQSEPASST
jgi:hypothetical protein